MNVDSLKKTAPLAPGMTSDAASGSEPKTLGRLNRGAAEVTIVGGGFSGLMCACLLTRRGHQVTLIEATDRLGGMISTEYTQWGISETAAHSVLANERIEAIFGSFNALYCEVHPEATQKWIYRHSQMRRMPLSVTELLSSLGRAFFARSRGPGQTIEQWSNQHLGPAVCESMIDPMLQGIYAAGPGELDLGATFPQWEVPVGKTLAQHLAVTQFKKVVSPLFRVASNEGLRPQTKSASKLRAITALKGMQGWIDAMEAELRASSCNLQLSQKLDHIPDAPNVVLATGARVASKLLKTHDPYLSDALAAVRHSSLVSATVFIKRERFKELPRGVGVLTAAGESLNCLGILFNSSSFEGRSIDGVVSLSVFLGGSRQPEIFSLSDQQITIQIEGVLQTLFGIGSNALDCVRIHRHKNAIPLYDQRVTELRQAAMRGWCAQSGRILLGNYTGGVSLRAITQQILDL